jgi:flagellar assembly protein FliH
VKLPALPREVRVRAVVARGGPAVAGEERERGAQQEAAKLESALRALSEAAREIGRRAERLETDAEPALLALVKSIASEILRREIEEGRYDLASLIRSCLAVARGVDRAVVKLHPADYDRAIGSTELAALGSHVVLRADPAVERAGCRVETPYGTVARDLETAVGDVFAAVDGRR